MDRRTEHLLEKIYLKKTEQYTQNGDEHFLGNAIADPDMEKDACEKSKQELIDRGYIEYKNDEIIITESGDAAARDLTRRYRLAERLLHDLLQVKVDQISKSACEMEHILSPAVTDSICTLLGHPPVCPHNKPIPPGECCKGELQEVKPIVVSLDEASIGVYGVITFIGSHLAGRIDKLYAMGISPGSTIKLIQRKPSPVVQIGESVIAIEDDIAREIFIRVGK